MELTALNRSFGKLGAIAFSMSPLGGPIVRLRSQGNEALIALQGGHVLSWTCGGIERLWLSPVSQLDTGKAVRGGIPVCWPWFGPHPFDETKAAHGFVRTRRWEVASTEATTETVKLVLAYETGMTDLAIWPQEAEVRLTVQLDAGLALSLGTSNLGDVPFIMTQALHTYFAVSDVSCTMVEGLDGLSYIDKVDGGIHKSQKGAVAIEGEVDRIYLGDTSRLALVDQGTGALPARRLGITSRGSKSAVVWNPSVDKTRRLGDMGSDEAWRRMLCIETTNAGDDLVRLAPGDDFVLSVRYLPG